MGGNVREFNEVEPFANHGLPKPPHYIQKFADKTFVEGGYAAKFVKVFSYTVGFHEWVWS